MKNKNWIKYLIIIIVVIAIIATIAVFIIKMPKQENNKITSKIKDELEYLDVTIIGMLNSLNNLYETDTAKTKTTEQSIEGSGASSKSSGKESSSGEKSESENSGNSSEGNDNEVQDYSVESSSILLRDKDKINWSDLENKAEDLYGSWVNITLDLNSEEVSKENILAYNSNLDNLLISIKEQNKVNSIISLANMYSLIPKYMEETSGEQEEIDIENIKSNIIFAYSTATSNDWDGVNNYLAQAESSLIQKTTGMAEISDIKQTSINKSYVLLKELIKSSNNKNIDLFYLKYINLMNELEKI